MPPTCTRSTQRTRQDSYQFRFIVSPEDATRLAELREFTRGLMGKMERDLATRLDWVAVDHWDTDNPHTHVVLRGVDDSGEDLFIAREYISHGMRFRACRLATDWLGPRTEREILASLNREVGQEAGPDWISNCRRAPRTTIDLASNADAVPWISAPGCSVGCSGWRRWAWPGNRNPAAGSCARAEATLRRMGERGDIIRTMQRALRRATRVGDVRPGPREADRGPACG